MFGDRMVGEKDRQLFESVLQRSFQEALGVNVGSGEQQTISRYEKTLQREQRNRRRCYVTVGSTAGALPGAPLPPHGKLLGALTAAGMFVLEKSFVSLE